MVRNIVKVGVRVVFSFRMPVGWGDQLSNTARYYKFNNRSEMLKLVLTDCAYRTITRDLKLKNGKIETPTTTISCRLPDMIHHLITGPCCRQLNDTASIWAALVINKWYQELLKNDKKMQKGNIISYRLFLANFADNYRRDIASKQHNIAIKQAVKQNNNRWWGGGLLQGNKN